MVSYNSPNIEDEYVDPDLKTVFTTESASAVASKLFSSTIPLRVLYDINIKRFYVCAADDLIHSDMLYLAIAFGYYPSLKEEDVLDYMDQDAHSNVECYLYSPHSHTASANDYGDYTFKFTYDQGDLYSRRDITVFESSPLYKALQSPLSHEALTPLYTHAPIPPYNK